MEGFAVFRCVSSDRQLFCTIVLHSSSVSIARYPQLIKLYQELPHSSFLFYELCCWEVGWTRELEGWPSYIHCDDEYTVLRW